MTPPGFKAEKNIRSVERKENLRQLKSECFSCPAVNAARKDGRGGGNLRRRGDLDATDFFPGEGDTFGHTVQRVMR